MTSTVPTLEGSTTASPWVPLWQIIERIASAIEDSRELEHYARTRGWIRQAALDGQLRIRGRHEIESAGQDRTNFSDVYIDIPSAYWKHSVIAVFATGATFEADRHTSPETVYAWGPKGLYETNCYAGLQLNSDDVSQLIDDVRGMGFSSDVPMSEKEEWVSAASAIALLGMKHLLGTRTICKRAHAGLIKARAKRFIRDGRSADNVDIPAEFWWAEGGAALDQNWTTGDFDTWIDHRIHLQAFGVTFCRSDIEAGAVDLMERPPIEGVHGIVEDRRERQMREKIFAFVLMPFDKEFDDTYFLGVKSTVEKAGMEAERVDEQIFHHEGILERVYNQINAADLIIADMTGRNPNVFYEVGYAHAKAKLCILLTKDANDIPFDLKHQRHIVYTSIQDLTIKLSNDLVVVKEESRTRSRLRYTFPRKRD